jgi:putative intracellular protease/amidase
MLVLVGAPSWETGGNGAALKKAGEFLRHGTPVAAICGATYGLARAGILDERKHTSNAPEYLIPSGYRGEANYVNERAVIDRNVITAGATGAIDFARQIFLALAYYPPRTIEAWYQLYRTGEPRYYAELMQAASPQ